MYSLKLRYNLMPHNLDNWKSK